LESGLLFLGHKISAGLYIPLSIILPFVITFVTIPTIVRVSSQKKLYDSPNERTSHEDSVPTLAGMSIFAGFILSVIIFSQPVDSVIIRYLFGACIILFFAGLKDDILIIDPKKKLISQILAALIIVILGDVRITDFHSVLGIGPIQYYTSVVFTMFLVVGLINAFNLIDGVDGLSAGIGILNSAVFGVWFLVEQQPTLSVIAFSLTGSLTAYFLFNVFGKENKIFMGDTGSMLTGLVISVLVIRFLESQNFTSPIASFNSAPAFAISLLMIPIFDTARVFVLRLINGKSPFEADRNHIHHNLLKLGLNHFQVTIVLTLTTILFVAISCIYKPSNAFWLIVFYLLAATALSMLLDSSVKDRKNK
jgi:UDP-N-acetylmuramyl pentapeptide phosphotransferase/UDP-N-acetylglucosamine-1-phosphate transferase